MSSDEYLGIHVDDWNETKLIDYAWVTSFSFLAVDIKKETLERFFFVTYGKKACGEFMERLDKYGECIAAVQHVWDRLPLEEKFISTDLFPPKGKKSANGVLLNNPHTLKTVYYSSACDAIRRFAEVFPQLVKDPLFLVGLVYCSEVANCPQYFYFEVYEIINSRRLCGKLVAAMEPYDFTHRLYEHLFDVVSGQKAKAWEYWVQGRFLPTSNTRAT